MKIVGNKLAEWANHETEVSDADLFGKSAFNRYYYSAYLITRELLQELNPEWTRQPHKGIPELLKKAIVKKVKFNIKKAEKLETMTHGEASKLKSIIMTATNELANLLSSAYEIRITADYEPDIHIVKSGAVFYLNKESIASAKKWPDQASSYTTSIRKVWKEVGLG